MVNRERPFNIHDLRLTRTGGPMINQERIKNLLLELVQIDSHSRKEREVAQRIKSYCEEMGAQVEIDDAGEKVGGNTGNVIARFAGTIEDAEPIMMSAHMDTVVPGEGVKPIVEGDIIRTDETTVLGGDDKSGCAAIKIAAEAISAMRLGRIDEETTANIGIIEGGKATNIIPNYVYLKGETRSRDEDKLTAQTEHMVKCFKDAAAKYEVTVAGITTKGRAEVTVEREYSAMDVPDSSHVVQLVIQAAKRMGLDVKTMASGGGCDANVFNRRGIECANLGTGMRAIHTVKEWLDVKDMYAAAEMTLEIMKLNGEMATK